VALQQSDHSGGGNTGPHQVAKFQKVIGDDSS
jgi:hypothetical protein